MLIPVKMEALISHAEKKELWLQDQRNEHECFECGKGDEVEPISPSDLRKKILNESDNPSFSNPHRNDAYIALIDVNNWELVDPLLHLACLNKKLGEYIVDKPRF